MRLYESPHRDLIIKLASKARGVGCADGLVFRYNVLERGVDRSWGVAVMQAPRRVTSFANPEQILGINPRRLGLPSSCEPHHADGRAHCWTQELREKRKRGCRQKREDSWLMVVMTGVLVPVTVVTFPAGVFHPPQPYLKRPARIQHSSTIAVRRKVFPEGTGVVASNAFFSASGHFSH